MTSPKTPGSNSGKKSPAKTKLDTSKSPKSLAELPDVVLQNVYKKLDTQKDRLNFMQSSKSMYNAPIKLSVPHVKKCLKDVLPAFVALTEQMKALNAVKRDPPIDWSIVIVLRLNDDFAMSFLGEHFLIREPLIHLTDFTSNKGKQSSKYPLLMTDLISNDAKLIKVTKWMVNQLQLTSNLKPMYAFIEITGPSIGWIGMSRFNWNIGELPNWSSVYSSGTSVTPDMKKVEEKTNAVLEALNKCFSPPPTSTSPKTHAGKLIKRKV